MKYLSNIKRILFAFLEILKKKSIEQEVYYMRMRFGGGVFLGAMVGAALSLMAEENFRMDRSMKAMNRAGRNIGRFAGKAYMSMRHML
jgi:hypothetical protein